jgi:hypothetical protein
VERSGATVGSNYREVFVGAPPGVNVVPVLYHQPRERAVDIVVHPDLGYPGSGNSPPTAWTAPQFITDATTMVNTALAEPVWSQYQSRINVWISQRTGAPTWPGTGNASTPNSTIWLADGSGPETWADSSGIVHRRQISNGAIPPVFAPSRDAALGNPPLFTANAAAAGAANIMRHEMGHAVFGLRDEYCCDGGYGQSPERPNLYSSAAGCQADLADLRGIINELSWPTPGATPCGSFQQVTPNPPPPGTNPTPVTWWRSEPSLFQSGAGTLQDLMVGNDYGLATDIRRFRWTFNQLCPEGAC